MIGVARSWAERLGGGLALQAAVVFGSVARGDFNKWSDIDVLVISDELPPTQRERLDLLVGRATPPGVQPVGWTTPELLARRAGRDPIAVESDLVGVVVLGVLPDANAGTGPTAQHD